MEPLSQRKIMTLPLLIWKEEAPILRQTLYMRKKKLPLSISTIKKQVMENHLIWMLMIK